MKEQALPDDATPAEAAAFWDARLRSPLCRAADHAAYHSWRRADPAHGEAFAALQQGLAALTQASETDARLLQMRRSAKRPPSRLFPAAAAAAAVCLVAGGSYLLLAPRANTPRAAAVAEYRTAPGQRTSVMLSDGSQLTLDSRSVVRVSYSAKERRLELLSGQALFKVAHQPERPFVVTAGERTVTAKGTVFNVAVDSRRMQVSMIDGRVEVERRSGPGLKRQLIAGQELVIAGGAETVRPCAIGTVLGWREGKLIFEGTPLSEAVDRVNLYTGSPITVADAGIADIRVSGMFLAARPEDFVSALTEYFPIQSHQGQDGSVYLTRRR